MRQPVRRSFGAPLYSAAIDGYIVDAAAPIVAWPVETSPEILQKTVDNGPDEAVLFPFALKRAFVRGSLKTE